ncbi:MAG: glycosyltransferase [Saccharospirillum sp.]
MKPKATNSDLMIKERGLSDTPIYNPSIIDLIKYSLYALFSFSSSMQLFIWVLKSENKVFPHLLKELLLLPSVYYCCRTIEKNNPDILHLAWGHYPVLVGKLLRIRGAKVKISMFLGAYDLAWDLGVTKSFIREVDGVVTHSLFNKRKIFDRYKIDAELIYRGVNRREIQKYSDLNHRENTTVFAGRLVEGKKPFTAIEIFRILLELNLSEKLIIAGDGPLRKRINEFLEKENLQDKVELVGHISQSQLFSILGSSRYFVLYSKKEGEILPNSLKEAVFLGSYVICNMLDAIEEFLVDEELGIIVDEGSLREDITSKREILGKLNRKNLDEIHKQLYRNFDSEVCMRKYIAYFDLL